MKRKKIIALLLVLALGGGGYWAWKRKKTAARSERFRTISVERGKISLSVQATGSVMPQNRLELKPPVAGRIEEMNVVEGQRVKKGAILAWLSSTERAALLDAARAKGEKELAYWQEVYKPTPLVSPMDGVVIARSMEPGQTVTTADAPLVMSDRLIVKAQVDETDIGRLKLNQQAMIILDAYPNNKVPAEISHIAYESKTVNNVTIYEVDVSPRRVPEFMRSGMTANLTFTIQEKDDVLVLPQEAIQLSDGKTRVLRPSDTADKKAKPAALEVRTGLSDGRRTEIVEGLAEGDKVLVKEMKWDKSESKVGGNPFSSFGGSGGGRSSGGGPRSR